MNQASEMRIKPGRWSYPSCSDFGENPSLDGVLKPIQDEVKGLLGKTGNRHRVAVGGQTPS